MVAFALSIFPLRVVQLMLLPLLPLTQILPLPSATKVTSRSLPCGAATYIPITSPFLMNSGGVTLTVPSLSLTGLPDNHKYIT